MNKRQVYEGQEGNRMSDHISESIPLRQIKPYIYIFVLVGYNCAANPFLVHYDSLMVLLTHEF